MQEKLRERNHENIKQEKVLNGQRDRKIVINGLVIND
jgi:hypothetical protein